MVYSGEYLTSVDNSTYTNTKSALLVLLGSPDLNLLGGSQTTVQVICVERRQFLHICPSKFSKLDNSDIAKG